MKVIFCIPTHSGTFESECVTSLFQAQALLQHKGIQHELFVLNGCPYLPIARANLVAMFMDDPLATDLFFIDSDVGFNPEAVLKIIERKESIVGGIYPLKQDDPDYPVKIKTIDGVPIGRDGLIEAEALPTGFMRIKREVFEKMKDFYPKLKYKVSDVGLPEYRNIKEIWDYFNMGIQDGEEPRWLTEDYAFCEKWAEMGGQMWVYADINFTHTGRKVFKGNYHESLLARCTENLLKKEIEEVLT